VLPSAPCWLQQVHGNHVIHLDAWRPGLEADAVWTDRPGQVCAILAADCLPILIADRQGELVGAVHAGWRGLAGDILAAMIDALPLPSDRLVAWIGPSISAPYYEVDAPVREAILRLDDALSPCFHPRRAGHWQADLKSVARRRLLGLGVDEVFDAKLCTAAEPQRFFSHRRDRGRSGRQANLIWIDPGRE
jgi:YfiH family protein